jgi:hypothetical protein
VSGEAGWTIEGERYGLFIGSGVSVDVAIPPGDDGSAVGRYFDRKSQPYRLWLERARPKLDALFARLVAEGVPLVPLAGKHEQVYRAVVEDSSSHQADDDRHFRRYYGGGSLLVEVRDNDRLPRSQTLALRLAVSTRVRRSQLERIADEVAAILVSVDSSRGA